MVCSKAEGSTGLRGAQLEPPTFSFSGPTVIVKVGPDLKEYHIHKELLMYHSGFFRGALGNKTFASAQDGVVTLEDVEPPLFEGFALFLYHGGASISEPGWTKLLSTKLAMFDYTSPVTSIVSCYVLADELLAPHAKAFFKEQGRINMQYYRPRYELIAFAYSTLPENSMMLDILADEHCDWSTRCDPTTEESGDDIQKLPAGFLYRVSLILVKLVRGEIDSCSTTLELHKEMAEEMEENLGQEDEEDLGQEDEEDLGQEDEDNLGQENEDNLGQEDVEAD